MNVDCDNALSNQGNDNHLLQRGNRLDIMSIRINSRSFK
jgi:hypothetical protein